MHQRNNDTHVFQYLVCGLHFFDDMLCAVMNGLIYVFQTRIGFQRMTAILTFGFGGQRPGVCHCAAESNGAFGNSSEQVAHLC